MHCDTLKLGNDSTVRGDGGSRVSEVRAAVQGLKFDLGLWDTRSLLTYTPLINYFHDKKFKMAAKLQNVVKI